VDDESCEYDEDVPVPSCRWRWLNLGIALMDFVAECSLSLARTFAEIDDAMRAHYNYEIDRRSAVDLLAEHNIISLTGE
jgi:hypothetical protein